MNFENSGLENLKIELDRLDEIMETHHMIRAGQWDYERVTYDHKFQIREGTYYLRIQGFAVEGDVGADDAIIELKMPLLGKHYYPHGIEYGEEEIYPDHLVKQCIQMIEAIAKDAKVFAE